MTEYEELRERIATKLCEEFDTTEDYGFSELEEMGDIADEILSIIAERYVIVDKELREALAGLELGLVKGKHKPYYLGTADVILALLGVKEIKKEAK